MSPSPAIESSDSEISRRGRKGEIFVYDVPVTSEHRNEMHNGSFIDVINVFLTTSFVCRCARFTGKDGD